MTSFHYDFDNKGKNRDMGTIRCPCVLNYQQDNNGNILTRFSYTRTTEEKVCSDINETYGPKGLFKNFLKMLFIYF